MLNLPSSDKTSETLFHTSAIIADLTGCAFADVHIGTCLVLHGFFLLLRPVDQQQRQLGVRLYCKWYCATSGIDVLLLLLLLLSLLLLLLLLSLYFSMVKLYKNQIYKNQAQLQKAGLLHQISQKMIKTHISWIWIWMKIYCN